MDGVSASVTRWISSSALLVGMSVVAAVSPPAARVSHAETCELEKLRVEAADPDTTVVCETRPLGTGSGIAPGRPSGIGNGGDVGGHGGGGHAAPRGVKLSPLQTSDYVFTDDGQPDNWQKTKCIAVRFLPLSPLGRSVDVEFTIGAPKRLGTGRVIKPEEAQGVALGVTTTVSTIIAAALTNGNLGPQSAPNQFRKYMVQALDDRQEGYRVNQCHDPANFPTNPG